MADNNQVNLAYPLTKMNFLVTVNGVDGTAAFSEVSGVWGNFRWNKNDVVK